MPKRVVIGASFHRLVSRGLKWDLATLILKRLFCVPCPYEEVVAFVSVLYSRFPVKSKPPFGPCPDFLLR